MRVGGAWRAEECEPMTEVFGQNPQRSLGAEPMDKACLKLKAFFVFECPKEASNLPY